MKYRCLKICILLINKLVVLDLPLKKENKSFVLQNKLYEVSRNHHLLGDQLRRLAY